MSPDALTIFARTLFDATVRPTQFLARWQTEPHRYWKPTRLLMTNGFVGGVAVTFSYRFLRSPAQSAHVPKLAQDIVSGVAPLVLAWLAVLSFRYAPRAVGATSTWLVATRTGAFVSTPGLATAPLAFALMAITKSPYAGLPLAVIIQVAYGTWGLRALPLTAARAFAGALVAFVIYIVAWFAWNVILMTLLASLGRWIPELRFGG